MVNCQVGFWDFYDVTINSNNHKFQMTLTSILKLITCLHVWYHTRWWDQITAASRTVLNFVSGTPAWYSDLAFQISWKIFFAVEIILSAGSVEAGIYMYFLASLAIFRKHDSCFLYCTLVETTCMHEQIAMQNTLILPFWMFLANWLSE